MSENNPPGKKRWEWLKLKPSRSDPHLPRERPTSDTSSPPPSSNESRGRPQKLARKLFGKAIKPFDPSAQQSSNPEPTGASSSADIQPVPVQSIEDPSPLIVATPEANIEQPSNPGIAKVEQPDQKFVNERITDATNVFSGIGHVTTIAQHTSSAANNLQSVSDKVDTFSALLGPLKVFNSIANAIADVHPYAKVALSIFTCASKMILDQADRDDAISHLLSKISEVYTFITEEEELPKLQSMLVVYGKIAQQTLECADFITHYSETKSAWIRLGKNIFDETDTTIKSYNNVFDSLMQQFRDQAVRDTVVTVHRMAESLDLSGMECAAGAGVNMSKCCLPDTRQELLTEIKDWIGSTEEGVPSVLWLSGPAGKGKSAVAHTIANWHDERGGLGSCFCFDRTQEADRRQDKIFTTIANDLADCNPIVRRALAQAVHDKNKLKRTPDLTRQWRELVVGPTSTASEAMAAPVLMVIDALDESGPAKSREQILRLLSGEPNTSPSQLSNIPAHFRILVTSRPLEDIHDALGTASHVRRVSMDDILPVSAERDIQLYVSTKLAGRRSPFDDGHFKTLAQKSDGLFEWARLACEYIKSTNTVSRGPMSRFSDISKTSAEGVHLLDEMYQHILADIMPRHMHKESIPIFQSVMGQILASLEPLPINALNEMREHFPCDDDRYDVNLLVGKLGSLVSGTSDSYTPIRPLHASFYDFLTDKSRSQDFFVDTSSVQSDLAFSSLRVMKHGLRFNICSLENSYLPNSAVIGLQKRVAESISAELSYSCRFWGTHVAATSFEATLAKEIEAFFDGERLLWWLEALALMKSLGGSVDALLSIAGWVAGDAEFTHISDAARDMLRFVRTFAPTILCSTPHLYLSALPFAPTQSRIFRQFAAKFPCTPRIVAGHVVNWPQMEKILHANRLVWSVALSPDRKRIACGLYDGTIQVWDTETGEASCAPLQGHTACVASVVFSPVGHRIVSGSWDKTVRVWDAATGKALGAPLQGHTEWVMSVAISPNGIHIVSGSCDETIRVWDVGTGVVLGSPLEGHTSPVASVAISPNGNHIVSGSYDMTIRVWDMKTGKALGVPLRGHTDYVHSVAISPDGKHIVSGSNDKTIRVWDMETGEEFGAPLQGHTASIQSVTISSDGHRIVSGSEDQTIRMWDMKTGEALGPPLQGHTATIQSVTISSDGHRIVSGSQDQTIRVWDMKTGEALAAALQSHTDYVNSVAISPDGRRIVSGSSDKTVRMWDMGTGKALTAPLKGHSHEVRSVAISGDGHRIISGSNDKTVRMWDLETGKALSAPLLGHTDSIDSVAISLDGCRIVSGSYDKTVRVWDVEAGEVSGHSLEGHSDWVRSVAISSDGNSIVSGSDDNTIQVWDMGTREASSACLGGHTSCVLSVAISPDGRRIVSGSRDETIQVWDRRTGEPLGAALQGHTDSINSVAISSDGNHIVSGSDDKTIQVWNMATGEAVGAPFRGHTKSVASVAISPDGKHIVSGSYDKTIRVWDIEFLNRIHPSTPAICFSPDPTHALRSAHSFLEETLAPYGPNEEGWVICPEGQLLFWIPLNFHPVIYAPGNTLVIANNPLQLDLSSVAHGTSWHECRTQDAASSSS